LADKVSSGRGPSYPDDINRLLQPFDPLILTDFTHLRCDP
jgi:hypothetical protein